jgi:MoxR-like ATPase
MTTTTNVLARVHALRQDLNRILLERESAVEAALLALLTQEHLLLLGPPGTAKSLLVRSICERIEGATYFERLLTRFSTICAAAHMVDYVKRGVMCSDGCSSCEISQLGDGTR